jgi:hypothetical protein
MMHFFPFLIPLAALCIPLTVVVGKYIVQPLAGVRNPQAGDDRRIQMLEQRLALMEQNVESMERSMARISEVADFHRELAAPSAAPPPPSI